jgi:hypothetical protein
MKEVLAIRETAGRRTKKAPPHVFGGGREIRRGTAT